MPGQNAVAKDWAMPGALPPPDGNGEPPVDGSANRIPALTAALFSAVRGHRGIENRVHWVLDVSMKEDACQIHRGESAEILACMRHLSLNLLRAETTKKASIRRKRRMASMDIGYLDKVLTAGFNALGKK
ncbi:transposase [Xenorhabdus sp. 18]|nr:transposase [Xenorhabdus sp. 18]